MLNRPQSGILDGQSAQTPCPTRVLPALPPPSSTAPIWGGFEGSPSRWHPQGQGPGGGGCSPPRLSPAPRQAGELRGAADRADMEAFSSPIQKAAAWQPGPSPRCSPPARPLCGGTPDPSPKRGTDLGNPPRSPLGLSPLPAADPMRLGSNPKQPRLGNATGGLRRVTPSPATTPLRHPPRIPSAPRVPGRRTPLPLGASLSSNRAQPLLMFPFPPRPSSLPKTPGISPLSAAADKSQAVPVAPFEVADTSPWLRAPSPPGSGTGCTAGTRGSPPGTLQTNPWGQPQGVHSDRAVGLPRFWVSRVLPPRTPNPSGRWGPSTRPALPPQWVRPYSV